MSNLHTFKGSSSLNTCDYDDATGKMTVCFASGGSYEIECAKSVYEGLRNAESAGKHYHAHIRNNYKAVKV